MATLAALDSNGDALCYSGGVGVSTTDVVVQTNDVARYDTFQLMSTAGAMQVNVSVDGVHYATAPLSLTDMGASTSTPVIVTAANRIYSFSGCYRGIQVQQNGATAVTGASLNCSRKGGPR